MNAYIEQTEALITPGGTAHDLLWNLSGSARKNYAKLPAHTLLRACKKACELIELIEDYDNADMNFAREENTVRAIIHKISKP